MKKKILIVILIITGLAVCVMGYFSGATKKQYQKEVSSALGLYSQSRPDILTEEDIAGLPGAVQKYIKYVGAIEKPKVWDFRAHMGGRMRNDDKSGWMSIDSVQYNFFDSPVRMFYINGKMFGIPAYGFHSYKNEEGIMRIKVLGLIPVVDQHGHEMNISDTTTILNDMCIFAPATLIDKRITWEQLDRLIVKATFTNGNNRVCATLYFNDNGELVNFVSDDRYRGYDKARWSTPIYAYKNFGDIRLPAQALAMWHFPDREFSYAEFVIEEVEYNVPVLK